MRPTTGLISRAGIAPKNLNFDSAGPMARNVTDIALMMNVLAFRDPKDPKNIQVWDEVEKLDPAAKNGVDFTTALDKDALKGKKLGVLRDLFEGDPEIAALADKAVATMKDLGATIVDIRLEPSFIEAHLKAGVGSGRTGNSILRPSKVRKCRRPSRSSSRSMKPRSHRRRCRWKIA